METFVLFNVAFMHVMDFLRLSVPPILHASPDNTFAVTLASHPLFK